jgi:hypothetical protein
MGTPLHFWLAVIELGDFTIQSETPLAEVLWFVAGLVLLAVLSTAVLWWSRRTRPDPFI